MARKLKKNSSADMMWLKRIEKFCYKKLFNIVKTKNSGSLGKMAIKFC